MLIALKTICAVNSTDFLMKRYLIMVHSDKQPWWRDFTQMRGFPVEIDAFHLKFVCFLTPRAGPQETSLKCADVSLVGRKNLETQRSLWAPEIFIVISFSCSASGPGALITNMRHLWQERKQEALESFRQTCRKRRRVPSRMP